MEHAGNGHSGSHAPVGENGDIEEGSASYRPGFFHPVFIGDVYNGKYEIVTKTGYGLYSTAWLVRSIGNAADSNESGGNKYYTLTVLSAECSNADRPISVRETLRHLRQHDETHIGYNFIYHLVDDFEHEGPNGTHICLVFELMGETLATFGTWFGERRLPNAVMKMWAMQLISALGYAHQCNVVHTNIRPDNIFVKFQDPSLIDTVYLKSVPAVTQNKTNDTYIPLQSYPLKQFYFDPVNHNLMHFDVALGDWGVARWTTVNICEVIQPAVFRAPEWNLGAVIFEVFLAKPLFRGVASPDGKHYPKEHLRQIIDLFGPFPKSLLEKSNPELVAQLFDESGYIKDTLSLGGKGLNAKSVVGVLPKELRGQFASFIHSLMKIEPMERVSMDLVRPWLFANASRREFDLIEDLSKLKS